MIRPAKLRIALAAALALAAPIPAEAGLFRHCHRARQRPCPPRCAAPAAGAVSPASSPAPPPRAAAPKSPDGYPARGQVEAIQSLTPEQRRAFDRLPPARCRQLLAPFADSFDPGLLPVMAAELQTPRWPPAAGGPNPGARPIGA